MGIMDKGCLHIHTGDGKGKTTVALGLAVRAAGAGMRVLFAQLLKSRSYSEHTVLERFHDYIEVRCFGTGEWVRDSPPPDQARKVREGIDELVIIMKSGKFDLAVLHESIVAVTHGKV